MADELDGSRPMSPSDGTDLPLRDKHHRRDMQSLARELCRTRADGDRADLGAFGREIQLLAKRFTSRELIKSAKSLLACDSYCPARLHYANHLAAFDGGSPEMQ